MHSKSAVGKKIHCEETGIGNEVWESISMNFFSRMVLFFFLKKILIFEHHFPTWLEFSKGYGFKKSPPNKKTE